RHQALVVHVHVGEDIGDRQRVGNVWIAGAPVLAFVGLLGEVVGARYLGDLVVVEITLQALDEIMNGGHGNLCGWRGTSEHPGGARCPSPRRETTTGTPQTDGSGRCRQAGWSERPLVRGIWCQRTTTL